MLQNIIANVITSPFDQTSIQQENTQNKTINIIMQSGDHIMCHLKKIIVGFI